MNNPRIEYRNQLYVLASELPPLPYAPFSEEAFMRLPATSKTVFRVLHRIVRDTVSKASGYTGIGIDALKRTQEVANKLDTMVSKGTLDLNKKEEVLEAIHKLLSHYNKGEKDSNLNKIVIALLNPHTGLPKTLSRDFPIEAIESAVSDYDTAVSEGPSSTSQEPKETVPKGEKWTKVQKTLTVAPVHVPWNKNLKFPDFVKSEFPGVQKNAPELSQKDVPFGKVRFVERQKGKVEILPWKKPIQTSPPTVIYSRGKKSYRPLWTPDPERPHLTKTFGLSRSLFRQLQTKIKRENPKKLKQFLYENDIPHEQSIAPSNYDKVIIQYLSGPWKDRRFPTKPFRVTAYIKGLIVYENQFSTQKEAEKATSVWVKTISRTKHEGRGDISFSYNKQRFLFYPQKIRKILAALEKGKRYRIHRLDGDYLIYRGEHPRVRNTWDVRKEVQVLHDNVIKLQKEFDEHTRAMESAPKDERLSYRPHLLKLRKDLADANTKYEKVKDSAKDVRSLAEDLEPMRIPQMKAWIRMVLVNE